jgi:hypothetical protein
MFGVPALWGTHSIATFGRGKSPEPWSLGIPRRLSVRLMFFRRPPRMMISVTRFQAFLNSAVEWEGPREPPAEL